MVAGLLQLDARSLERNSRPADAKIKSGFKQLQMKTH